MTTITSEPYWQAGKSLSESFDYILTSSLANDVTFIVGQDKERISAHKLVLICRSPVFFAMLMGHLADTEEITIPDISSETFKILLRYLYTDKIDLTVGNVVPVCYAANKYLIEILVSQCEAFLDQYLTVDKAFELLHQSHELGMNCLVNYCLRFIAENATAVLDSVVFTHMCWDCVESVTAMRDLNIDETGLYDAVVRWAKTECVRQNLEVTAENKREVLGDILFNVRFDYIDKDFFLDRVCPDMILRPHEIEEIMNHNRNNEIVALHYTERRIGVPKRFNRNGTVINGKWTIPVSFEAISFQSSVDVYLFGFGSFFTVNGRGNVDLKVFEDNVLCIAATKSRSAPQPDTPSMGDVILEPPIKIRAGKTYTIVERSHDIVNHHFNNGIDSVSKEDITLAFTNSPMSTNTDVSMGQIPYLLLFVSCYSNTKIQRMEETSFMPLTASLSFSNTIK
ncbi:BTB/POZ domain-containing protein 1-like [Ylistrum balloti]|uniref:BTB/POZ domain-containing protein 1-like n=1 Tax=Ylistrum balloti TaxID=509963 RepID=UPI0029059087|nr:BTB/POZ domain-containing protein 1-like [Ylistrum balloti]